MLHVELVVRSRWHASTSIKATKVSFFFLWRFFLISLNFCLFSFRANHDFIHVLLIWDACLSVVGTIRVFYYLNKKILTFYFYDVLWYFLISFLISFFWISLAICFSVSPCFKFVAVQLRWCTKTGRLWVNCWGESGHRRGKTTLLELYDASSELLLDRNCPAYRLSLWMQIYTRNEPKLFKQIR